MEYEDGADGNRRRWTYARPVGRPETREKAAGLLPAHVLEARADLDRKIARLMSNQRASE